MEKAMGFAFILFSLILSYSPLADATVEADLAAAISSPWTSTFIIRESINFTANLPPILTRKKLTVVGVCNNSPDPQQSKCTLDFKGFQGFRVLSGTNITVLLKSFIIKNCPYGMLIKSNGFTHIFTQFVDFHSPVSIDNVELLQMKSCSATNTTFSATSATLIKASRFRATSAPFQISYAGYAGFYSSTFIRSQVKLDRSEGGSFYLSNFTDTSVNKGGGALQIRRNLGPFYFIRCSFKRNVARGNVIPTAGGGAMWIGQSDVRILESSFDGNRALKSLGGAIHVVSWAKAPTSLSLCSNTFTNNFGINNTASTVHAEFEPSSNTSVPPKLTIATKGRALPPFFTIAAGTRVTYAEANCTH